MARPTAKSNRIRLLEANLLRAKLELAVAEERYLQMSNDSIRQTIALSKRLEEIESSKSWRWTAPIRSMIDVIRGLRSRISQPFAPAAAIIEQPDTEARLAQICDPESLTFWKSQSALSG